MIHSRQRSARGQARNLVGVRRRKGVFVDHRRAATGGGDAGDVLPGVNARQVLVGCQARLEHGAALLAEARRYRFKGFCPLRPLRMPGGGDVIRDAAG